MAYWGDKSFIHLESALTHERTETNLPFNIGGGSQHGTAHARLGISNQDNFHLYIGEYHIIGLVCDGCTSSDLGVVSEFSNNQVGAGIVGQIVLNYLIDEFIFQGRKRLDQRFLKVLSSVLLQKIKKLLRTNTKEKKRQENLLYNYLTTTILGFVISKDNYLVFHCGDGCATINDEIFDLSTSSGEYFSNHINHLSPDYLKLIKRGKTKTLESICLLSDGFLEGEALRHKAFTKLIHKEHEETGLIDVIPEFNIDFLNNFLTEENKAWPKDDASFVLLRRSKKSAMLELSSNYVLEKKGLLNAISCKSVQYLHGLLLREHSFRKRYYFDKQTLSKLQKSVVHTNPHIDEYFADLLFRTVLPMYKIDLDIEELSIYSRDNDSNCQLYWPHSVIFGIGGQASGGAKPLLLFDEHLEEGERDVPSCSAMVSREYFNRLPKSLYTVLNEVSEIDAKGKAHEQSITNLIKTINDTRYLFHKEVDSKSIQGTLSTPWKRSIMDASISAIVFCLEEFGIHLLLDNPDEKAQSLERTLSIYISGSPLKTEQFFDEAVQRIKSNFKNQKGAFKRAKLFGTRKDQLLILGRVAWALDRCWGEDVANIVMVHYWEAIFQNQLSFLHMYESYRSLVTSSHEEEYLDTDYGKISKISLPISNFLNSQKTTVTNELLLLVAYPSPRWSQPNKVMRNTLNKHNDGYGFSLICDNFSGTKAIFKGDNIDQDLWERVIDKVKEGEEECWFVLTDQESGRAAAFILNGNKAHQYVEASTLDADKLRDILVAI